MYAHAHVLIELNVYKYIIKVSNFTNFLLTIDEIYMGSSLGNYPTHILNISRAFKTFVKKVWIN